MRKKMRQFLCLVLAVYLLVLAGCTPEKAGSGLSIDAQNAVMSERRAESIVNKSLALLPDIYREKILEEGWSIVITKEDIETLYEINQKIDDVTGLTDTKKRKIYVEEDTLPDSLLHELCHACLYNPDTQSSFYIQYDGYEREQRALFSDPYYRENYDEYIVECMAMYFRDETSLDDYPVTKATVVEMSESTDWIFHH